MVIYAVSTTFRERAFWGSLIRKIWLGLVLVSSNRTNNKGSCIFVHIDHIHVEYNKGEF